MTTPRAATLTPATVGPRLSLVTALLAAAVLFGVGMLAGRMVSRLAGLGTGADHLAVYGTAAVAAAYSLQASVRRMVRARASRRSPAPVTA